MLPELNEDAINNEVTLTLTMEKATSQNKNVGVNVGVKMTKTEKRVVELFSSSGNMTTEQLAEAIGVSQRTIERCIGTLKKKKVLVRHGADKDGY